MNNTPAASPSPAAPVPSSLFPSPPPRPHWCVVLPAYNEEENLPHVVDDVLATFKGLDFPCNILIINDGSTDGTGEIADQYASRHDNVRVIHHSSNYGVGVAWTTGYANATGDFVVVIPSDRQFRCDDLKKCLPFVADHDVVICVRRDRKDPVGRRIASGIYRALMRLLFRLDVEDINWVKIYRLSLLGRIKTESVGPFLDAEILIKATLLGARMKQVDVPHYPRVAGKATGAGLRAMAKTFTDLFRLWHRLRGARSAVSPVAGSTDQHPANSAT